MNEDIQAISCQDIHALNRRDGFKMLAPVIRPGDVALRGRFCSVDLRSGLRLHATDAVDLHDLVTQARCAPGLTISLFLQGSASVSLGQRAFSFGSGDGGPHAFALNCAEPDLFERRGLRGRRVRKVNVNVPQSWLDAEGLPTDTSIRQMCAAHLAVRSWVPSARHLELAERLLAPAPDVPFLESLYQETLALEFVAETLRQWSDREERPGRPGGRDHIRLRRACDYIDAHQDSRLHVDDVAREAGMSISALQRLFHAALGSSVLEFARVRRLHRAREALERGEDSVTDIALTAGYSSPANFATAFKRLFGVSPKDIRTHG